MIAYEVHLNGEKLCLASVGEHGVLSQILTWSESKPKEGSTRTGERREPFLSVGGLVDDEHVDWIGHRLMEVGDELTIVIVEVESADEPVKRKRRETGEERAQRVSEGLAASRALLPFPLVEGDWLASLRGYEALLEAGEPEVGLKILARLGDLNGGTPEFWQSLHDIARVLKMYNESHIYHDKADAKQMD